MRRWRFPRPPFGHRTRLVAGLLAIAAALHSGCSADAVPQECETSLDCLTGQLCQAGSCFNACIDDIECGVGRICDDGLCVGAQRCAESDDCLFGFVCVEPYCVRQRDECRGSIDCPPGLVCDRGACVQDVQLECVTPDDCAPDERCLDNVCVPDEGLPDVEQPDTEDGPDTEVPDTDLPDTGPGDDVDVPDTIETDPDPGDTAVVPDEGTPDVEPECRSLLDCPTNFACIGGVCVNEFPDAGPADTGTDTGPTCTAREQVCDRSAECCSERCVPISLTSDSGVCTTLCTDYDSCNPAGGLRDYFCGPVGALGGGTEYVCLVSDFGERCSSAATCLGQACLRSRSASTCTWQCASSADCPPDTVCGPVETSGGTLNLCSPIGETCRLLTDCLSGTCLTDDVTGIGYCTQFCNPLEPGACPAGWLCDQPDPTLPGINVCILP